jgi:CubicO group peptidase (beta-lactamase class C family)
MSFPLSPATPSSLGLDPRALDRLQELITGHLAEDRYPGAQIAVARAGKLALFRTFGDARVDPARTPARDDSLWLLYSNTKLITACAIWVLAEQGTLRFTDRVAEHVPGFEANGKGDITIVQLLSHQGGFPNADVPRAAWEDHELLRRAVSGFTLEWTPGSRVHYHSRAAHWVAAVLIEALTKTDYRAFIREQVIEPLGLGDELFVGLPDDRHERATDMHEPAASGAGEVKRAEENNAEFRRAGTPAGGGYASARAMAAFYQMLAAGGTLEGRRPVRHAQRHRRPGGRLHGHAHAPCPGAPRARDHREHPGPRDHRLAANLRPWRRGLVLLLGRPRLGGVVRVPDQ